MSTRTAVALEDCTPASNRWNQRGIISPSHKCLLNSHSTLPCTMKDEKTETSVEKRSGGGSDDLLAFVYSPLLTYTYSQSRGMLLRDDREVKEKGGGAFSPSLNHQSSKILNTSIEGLAKRLRREQRLHRTNCCWQECVTAACQKVSEFTSSTGKSGVILSCESGRAAIKRSLTTRGLALF